MISFFRALPAVPALGLLALTLPSCTLVKSTVAPLQSQPVDAALSLARQTWQALPRSDEASDSQATQWRLALGGVLNTLEKHGEPGTWTGTQSIQGWTVTFAGDTTGLHSVPPSWCDRITPVEKLKALPGIKGKRVSGDGVGLPVVMHQPRLPGTPEKFVPPNGRHYPATFTAEFTGDRAVTLTFHNTRSVRSAGIHGKSRALAYDVSAAIADAMSPSYYSKYSLRGLIRPDSTIRDARIYATEPYDPDKIPVVFIHGIESAPHIWANMMNEMAADPVLRDRCQSWFFLYPTGLSIQAAAAQLRESLTEARNYYDPRHLRPEMNRIALVGHSMGGLLSKMQIMDSGDDLYHAFWTRPLDQLPLDQDSKSLVTRTLNFKRLPFVSRAVFITTPHHGSRMVDISIMRTLFRLVRPDKAVVGMLKQVGRVAQTVVNPELMRFKTFGTRSNETLSPYHPMLKALNNRPLRANYNTIIASFPPLSRKKAVEDSTDGVVPYKSAWLPGAESTTVITGFHTCIPSPALAEALVPILRRHAQQR